jgi:hypothetical protein
VSHSAAGFDILFLRRNHANPLVVLPCGCGGVCCSGIGDGVTTLAAWPKWQGQNPFSALIHHEHHQSQIVVAAFLAQLLDYVLGIRKGRRNIWQIRTIKIILDPILSVYREEILRHRLPLPPTVTPPGNSSGSLAMFAAIRRASSLLSNLAADWRPGSHS